MTMAEKPEVRYGNYDDLASRFAPNEAWVLNAKRTEWAETNAIRHAHVVHELSKEAFEAEFPDAPPLPPEAFKESRG